MGYVGLPVAVALARAFEVVGFDIDTGRIAELRQGRDRTGEIDPAALAASALKLSDNPADCRGADIYVVTVPTPVDADNRPDLAALLGASQAIGGWIDPIRRLEQLGHEVVTADPLADVEEARREYGVDLVYPSQESADLVIGAVAHNCYRAMGAAELSAMVKPGGLLADIKGMWRSAPLDPSIARWAL